MRFRTLLVSSLLAVSLLPLAAFTALQWREAQSEIARADEAQRLWAQRAAVETQTALDDARRFVLLAAEMGAVAMEGRPTARAAHTLQLSLEQIAGAYGLFENLHLDDARARSLLFFPKTGESTAPSGKAAHDIELVPKKKSDIVRVELQIEKFSGLPASIAVFSKNGISSTIRISKMKTGVNQPDSYFVFNEKDYPDAEIIDLR